MLRRQCARLGVASRTLPLLATHQSHVVDPTKVQARKAHERSKFVYEGSAKATEVGARNEAAFVDYQRHEATTTEEKLAMPHQVNLMSAMPVLLLLSLVVADTWGLVLWHCYVAGRYSPVVIARPASA